MLSPMLQEGFYDTSWDGTWRDAIKEKSAIEREADHVTSITSSRESACLNTRIVVLTPTKGKDRPMIIPTLSTVSLWINSFQLASIFFTPT
jgi:hypothetical protein